MKKHVIIFCLSCGLFHTGLLKAQDNRAGETMLSLGVGYSDNFNQSLQTTQLTSELPEFSGTLDYFVIRNYSVGVSAAYQSISGSGVYTNGASGVTTPYTATASRLNISIRSLVYFTKENKPGLYAGIRLGYAFYNYTYNPVDPYTSTNPYPYYYNYSSQPNNLPTLQVFVGARASITDSFSTFFELGSGTPYYAEMGFSFNIGGSTAVNVSRGGIGEYGTPPPVQH